MKRLFACILIFILSLGVICAVGCVKYPTANVPKNESSIDFYISNPMSVTTDTGVSYIRRTITATVYPSDATHKVNYSVAWAEEYSDFTESVENYIKVVQATEGSLTAEIQCYKDFTGKKIIITATSLSNSSIKGSCIVSFIGYADTININFSAVTNKYNVVHGGNYYELKEGNSYSISYDCSNAINAVNASDFEISFYAIGYIQTRDEYEWESGLTDTQLSILSIDSLIDYLFDIDVIDNTIKLNAKCSVDNINLRDDNIGLTSRVLLDYTSSQYYFVLKIKELKSGLTEFINLWITR